MASDGGRGLVHGVVRAGREGVAQHDEPLADMAVRGGRGSARRCRRCDAAASTAARSSASLPRLSVEPVRHRQQPDERVVARRRQSRAAADERRHPVRDAAGVAPGQRARERGDEATGSPVRCSQARPMIGFDGPQGDEARNAARRRHRAPLARAAEVEHERADLSGGRRARSPRRRRRPSKPRAPSSPGTARSACDRGRLRAARAPGRPLR